MLVQNLRTSTMQAAYVAGLRPGSLTKAERLHFGARSLEYLDAR